MTQLLMALVLNSIALALEPEVGKYITPGHKASITYRLPQSSFSKFSQVFTHH